jgi:hypothetical protein
MGVISNLEISVIYFIGGISGPALGISNGS